ncbi:MAG: sigma-54 dependent transcriptional regulator [Planctomycetaceae bacterium]|jgi:two-component system NtrC family response regulator|nr:sigma-54 dependent transcriptional regulator [Planctomycetaceae bacterium]
MNILFADDEKNIREVLTDELLRLDHAVTPCQNGMEALAAVCKEPFDVLLLDLDMPGANGLTVLEKAKEHGSDADIVILTGKGTLESAQHAVHHGIAEFLTKPCKIADLEKILNSIAEKRKLNKRYSAMINQPRYPENTNQLVGHSEPMQQVYRMIDRIAPTDSTVVILGETGTGKELAARAIHNKSPRFDKPFVAVNCGALPETLIESELFGHRKGSFTGADANRTGLFEVANGGTLFLDEIGELPKGVQAKLLRFLESGEVRKIGENTATVCNVRVVCATLRQLETMVHSGEFREDLWFRINTFEIHLPALRERKDDIPALIDALARRFQPNLGNLPAEKLFTEEAYRLLLQYDWPGNVRQLANTIEHALVLSDGFPVHADNLPQMLKPKKDNTDAGLPVAERITEKKPNRPVINKIVRELTPPFDSAGNPATEFTPVDRAPETAITAQTATLAPETTMLMPETTTLRDLEMKAIFAALNRHEGNKAKAAEELGISLKTLYNKLNQSEKRIA